MSSRSVHAWRTLSSLSCNDPYYDLSAVRAVRLKRDDAYVEAAIALLAEGTRSVLAGHARPAISLSGGLDSQAVAACVLAQRPDQALLGLTSVPSAGFEPLDRPDVFEDERHHVTALAALYPMLDSQLVDSADVPFDHRLDDMFRMAGAVPRNVVNFPWIHRVHERARAAGCDVLLVGSMGNVGFSFDGPAPCRRGWRAGTGSGWRASYGWAAATIASRGSRRETRSCRSCRARSSRGCGERPAPTRWRVGARCTRTMPDACGSVSGRRHSRDHLGQARKRTGPRSSPPPAMRSATFARGSPRSTGCPPATRPRTGRWSSSAWACPTTSIGATAAPAGWHGGCCAGVSRTRWWKRRSAGTSRPTPRSGSAGCGRRCATNWP